MASKSKRRAVRAKPTKKAAVTRSRSNSVRQTTSKLDTIVASLRSAKGATLSQLMDLTGWQQHSIRGALAGALKKRGHTVTSAKTGAERVYRIEPSK